MLFDAQREYQDEGRLLCVSFPRVAGGQCALRALLTFFSHSHQRRLSSRLTTSTFGTARPCSFLLAHSRYNLGLVQCQLVYGLMIDLVSGTISGSAGAGGGAGPTALHVELLLVLLREIGPRLRSDDPRALAKVSVGCANTRRYGVKEVAKTRARALHNFDYVEAFEVMTSSVGSMRGMETCQIR